MNRQRLKFWIGRTAFAGAMMLATTVGAVCLFQDAILRHVASEPKTWSGTGPEYDAYIGDHPQGRDVYCVATMFKAAQGSVTNEAMKRLFGKGMFAAEREVEMSLMTQPGLIEWSVRVDLSNRMCATMTRWISRDSVERFLELNQAHLEAMDHSSDWVESGTARVTSQLTTVDFDGYMPGFTEEQWQTALSQLKERGEVRY